MAHYQPPPPGAKLPELHEIAEVDSLAAAIAKLDRAFDELKLCQKSDWRTPAEHPDLVPRAAAALVREQLRESARLLTEDRDAQFKAWLNEAEATASKLEAAIENEQPGAAAAGIKALEKACERCHAGYRN